MSRLETMAARIKPDLPEFIKLIPPTERSEGLYRRIRHIQIHGECCGTPMTMKQLKDIIALAARESVHNPLHFLCRVLDRLHVQKTLQNACNGQKLDIRVRSMAHYVKLESAWQIRYLSDLITGKYSMDDLMTACEIAAKKKHPDRYLIAMFKNGYDKEKFAKKKKPAIMVS